VAGLTIIVDGLGYGMKQFSGMSLPDVKLMMNSMEVSYQLYTLPIFWTKKSTFSLKLVQVRKTQHDSLNHETSDST
jgi:hypothetical protein